MFSARPGPAPDRPGPPRQPGRHHGDRATGGAVHDLGVRRRGGRAAAAASTRSTSPTWPNPSRTRSICWLRRATARCRPASRRSPTAPVEVHADPGVAAQRQRPCRGAGRRAVVAAGRAATWRSWPTWTGPGTARRAGLRGRARRPDRPPGHLRLGPAVPALDRPVPQGRAAATGSSCRSPARCSVTSRCPGSRSRFGRLQLAQAAGDAAGAARSTAGRRAPAAPAGTRSRGPGPAARRRSAASGVAR